MANPAVSPTCSHPNGGMCICCAPWMFPNPKPEPVPPPPFRVIETEATRWYKAAVREGRVRTMGTIIQNIRIGMACGSYQDWPYNEKT
jgi:hypothetical protein